MCIDVLNLFKSMNYLDMLFWIPLTLYMLWLLIYPFIDWACYMIKIKSKKYIEKENEYYNERQRIRSEVDGNPRRFF